MKVRNLAILAAVGGVVLAGSAQAGITSVTMEQVDFSTGYQFADGSVDVVSAGAVSAAVAADAGAHQTWRMWVNVDSPAGIVAGIAGSVINGIPLIMETDGAGGFFNHAFGGNTAPNTGLMAVFGDIAFDSYLTMGAAAAGGPGLTPGFVGDLGPYTLGANFNAQNAGYTVVPAAGQGVVADGLGGWRVLVGQFTIDSGASLHLSGNAVGGGNTVFYNLNIPAPGALALLGLAGLAGTRRRRA